MFHDANGQQAKNEMDALPVDDLPFVFNPESPLPSLQIRTDLPNTHSTSPRDSDLYASLSGSYPRRTPSLRALIAPYSSAGSLSPASMISSPQLNAMGDITPLPSPIGGASPWRRSDLPSLSRSSSIASRSGSALRLSDSSQMLGPPALSRPRSKQSNMGTDGEESPGANRLPRESSAKHSHSRNRSLSDYVPPSRVVVPRPIAVSGNAGLGIAPSSSTDSKSNGLHREQYLAVHRGIALSTVRPPTPPRSSGSGYTDQEPVIRHPAPLSTPQEVYSVRSVHTQQARMYQKIRVLGQGTFSQVSLAARVEAPPEILPLSPQSDGGTSFHGTVNSQKLVAVKIIEHGPAGGADEGRLEVSLKREVDILKSINHPSLVQLKAFGNDDKRALLVLDYCPGGDMFDFATSGAPPMSPGLIRRIFSELVGAVRYLHSHYIVHRDIKLESESPFARAASPHTNLVSRCSTHHARSCHG